MKPNIIYLVRDGEAKTSYVIGTNHWYDHEARAHVIRHPDGSEETVADAPATTVAQYGEATNNNLMLLTQSGHTVR